MEKWRRQGYSHDIPDEVPLELHREALAPSWKAVAACLLSNDLQLSGLGYSRPASPWYSVLKRIELGVEDPQLRLF